ncbi:MAG: nucleoside transporter C-terminal domain-containing protein [Bacteroidota bacterium]
MDIFLNILRGFVGMGFLIGILYLLSANKKAINWRLVFSGLAVQLVLALLIFYVPPVRIVFDWMASFFVVVLQFAQEGIDFLFASFITNEVAPGLLNFAFNILPTIVFFAALSSVLYYLGVLQVIIKGFAWAMSKTMQLTGAESLAAAANVFIGQTEAPLVVKPYLEDMSKSELLCLMTGGMATIAGSVFGAYVGYLGGDDPVQQQLFATHLLTASIMSAPAAIVAAKMLYPEDREVDLESQKLNIPPQQAGSNLLDAISRGTTDGLKLAINVGAMLLVFTALVAMVNFLLGQVGSIAFGNFKGLNEMVVNMTEGRFDAFNLEFLLGLLFAPIAWLLGVNGPDLLVAGQMLGLKTTLNEFFAYAQLEGIKEMVQPKTLIILTYALCGFANFASIGIQIGGIGAIAPGTRKTLSEFGIKALIGGTIAAFFTAIIAGMLFGSAV